MHHRSNDERQPNLPPTGTEEKAQKREETPAKPFPAHRHPKAARISFDANSKLQNPPSIAEAPSPQLTICQGNKPFRSTLRRRRSCRRTPQHCCGRRLETPDLGERVPKRCKRGPSFPAHDVLMEGLVVGVRARQLPQAYLWVYRFARAREEPGKFWSCLALNDRTEPGSMFHMYPTSAMRRSFWNIGQWHKVLQRKSQHRLRVVNVQRTSVLLRVPHGKRHYVIAQQ